MQCVGCYLVFTSESTQHNTARAATSDILYVFVGLFENKIQKEKTAWTTAILLRKRN